MFLEADLDHQRTAYDSVMGCYEFLECGAFNPNRKTGVHMGDWRALVLDAVRSGEVLSASQRAQVKRQLGAKMLTPPGARRLYQVCEHMPRIMSIRPENWMESLFASPAQVRLLRVLAQDPSKSWTEREAAAAAGLPPSTGHLVFRRLHGTGVLEVRRVGRSHSVRLRPELRLTILLREFFQAEASTQLEGAAKNARTLFKEHEAEIRKVLRKRGVTKLTAFGSRARGEGRPDSDLDLAGVMPAKADYYGVVHLQDELVPAKER